MAIKRCPYCKAIIDERDRVCSNCGTQLLFPEDEFVEEDRPGDEMKDEDFEKEESPAEEFEPEELDISSEDERKKPSGKKKEKEEMESPEAAAEVEKEIEKPVKEFEEAEFQGKTEEEEKKEKEEIAEKEEEPVGAEVEVPEEIEPLVIPEEEELEEPVFEEEKREAEGPAEKEEEEQMGEEVEVPEKGVEEEEVPALKVPSDFETMDLFQIPTPKTVEMKRIEEFLQNLKEREESPFILEQKVSPPSAKDTEEKVTETEGELPPWAKRMKEPPLSETPEEREEREEEGIPKTEEEFLEEEVYEPEAPAVETDIGIREEVEQRSLPFVEEREMEKRIKPRSRLLQKLKAKAFDLFFITALWFITIWLASRLMNSSLFTLVSVSVLSIIIFYLILLFSYFSLFLYFLGETLGDRLFFQKD